MRAMVYLKDGCLLYALRLPTPSDAMKWARARHTAAQRYLISVRKALDYSTPPLGAKVGQEQQRALPPAT